MDKPVSMDIRTYLVKQVSTEMELEEDLVSKIIVFQGEDALRAVREHSEIEFSGFGKFLISQHKVKREIEHLNKALLKPSLEDRREGIQRDLDFLKSKLCQD